MEITMILLRNWRRLLFLLRQKAFNRHLSKVMHETIRISSSMLNRIKYIAAYQVAPISAITHLAEVAKIEKYKDANLIIKERAPKRNR